MSVCRSTRNADLKGTQSAMQKARADMPTLLAQFDVPLGAGGFGIVKGHQKLDAAAKFIRSAIKCDEARVEAERQQTAASAINALETSNINNWHSRVSTYVPIPILYSKTGAGSEYACFFIMERVHGLSGIPKTRGRMVHLALAGTIPRSGLFGTDYSKSEAELETSDVSQLRGYFVGPEEVNNFVESIRKAGYRCPDPEHLYAAVGRVYGAILGAGLDARDIEIVLAEDPCPIQTERYGSPIQRTAAAAAVWVMDFGMCVPFDATSTEQMLRIYSQVTIDLYAPSYTTANRNNWSHYAHGLLIAFRLCYARHANHANAQERERMQNSAEKNLAMAMETEILDAFDQEFLGTLQVNPYVPTVRATMDRIRKTRIGALAETSVIDVLLADWYGGAPDRLAIQMSACCAWYHGQIAEMLAAFCDGTTLQDFEKKYDSYKMPPHDINVTPPIITEKHKVVFMECASAGSLVPAPAAGMCSRR
jgi:hypothetical protein